MKRLADVRSQRKISKFLVSFLVSCIYHKISGTDVGKSSVTRTYNSYYKLILNHQNAS